MILLQIVVLIARLVNIQRQLVLINRAHIAQQANIKIQQVKHLAFLVQQGTIKINFTKQVVKHVQRDNTRSQVHQVVHLVPRANIRWLLLVVVQHVQRVNTQMRVHTILVLQVVQIVPLDILHQATVIQVAIYVLLDI